MGTMTYIEWCNHTFNCHRGCTKISRGCQFCYADVLSHRNPGTLGVWGPGGTRVVAAESAWRQPPAWDRAAARAGERRRVFCASLSDVFEAWDGPVSDAKGRRLYTWHGCWPWASGGDDDPTGDGYRPLTLDDVRARLWQTVLATPSLDWLLLTKRPENVLPSLRRMYEVQRKRLLDDGCLAAWIDGSHPPDNVWLGVSCEDQAAADARIPHLLQVPAAVRFLSCEPLLGPVDLKLEEWQQDGPGQSPYCALTPAGQGIRWVIVGGESGPKARPMHPQWARSLRDQCVAAGVSYFFKQHGEYVEWTGEQSPSPSCRMPDMTPMVRVGKKAAGRTLDGREWSEFPQPREVAR